MLIFGPLVVEKIEKHKQISFTPSTGAIVIGICSCSGAFLSICLLRNLGKRPIVVSGFLGCGLCHLLTAISYSSGFMEGTLIGMGMMVLVWQSNIGGVFFIIICEVL